MPANAACSSLAPYATAGAAVNVADGHERLGERDGYSSVGIEREMRTVLLTTAYRQGEDPPRPDIGPAGLAEASRARKSRLGTVPPCGQGRTGRARGGDGVEHDRIDAYRG